MAKLPPLRLGTRGSALARWQAEWVAAQLAAAGVAVVMVPITTQGDVETKSLASLVSESAASPGLFTKEIQRALLDGRIDLAVHSLKDLPTDPVPGLVLAAVPPREDVADVLISRLGARLMQLPAGATIGTGSLRRRAQLLHVRPQLAMRDIRGNVDTRLRKLADGEFDAIVLAAAGLKRLGQFDRASDVLPMELMLPAVGQGALGIEVRSDDKAAQAAIRSLDHLESHAAVTAERTLLAALRGGCLAPVAAWCRAIDTDQIELSAVVLSFDGSQRLATLRRGSIDQAATIGQSAAEDLLAAGAASLIETARSSLR